MKDKENNQSNMLQDKMTRNIVIIILFLEVFTFLIPTLARINMTGGMAAVLPAVLADLTNEKRQEQNLAVLTVNPMLNQAAEMKATDMATKGYFAHTSPEGKNPWYWLAQVGYKYEYAGENLAINFSDSKDVTDAWMASPTHKANIVKGNYTEVGTGVATGMYEGHEAIFVAQVYANPAPVIHEVVKPVETNKVSTVNKSEVKKISTTPRRRAATPVVTIKQQPTSVLGAEATTNSINAQNVPSTPAPQPTFWQKLLASPRNTTNTILYIIFGIIAVILLCYLFIKIKHRLFDLITNGLVVLAMIGGIFVINYYFSHSNMVIAQSLNYSSENKD